jgi:hypothetical protein
MTVTVQTGMAHVVLVGTGSDFRITEELRRAQTLGPVMRSAP